MEPDEVIRGDGHREANGSPPPAPRVPESRPQTAEWSSHPANLENAVALAVFNEGDPGPGPRQDLSLAVEDLDV